MHSLSVFRRHTDAAILDTSPDKCRRCFIWNAACYAQILSDPDVDCNNDRVRSFFDIASELLEELAMQVLEATYYTRDLMKIKCIRKAFRLGIKVFEDLKAVQQCP